MRSTKIVMHIGEALWIVGAFGVLIGSVVLAFLLHWIAGVVVVLMWGGMFWLVDQAIGPVSDGGSETDV